MSTLPNSHFDAPGATDLTATLDPCRSRIVGLGAWVSVSASASPHFRLIMPPDSAAYLKRRRLPNSNAKRAVHAQPITRNTITARLNRPPAVIIPICRCLPRTCFQMPFSKAAQLSPAWCCGRCAAPLWRRAECAFASHRRRSARWAGPSAKATV